MRKPEKCPTSGKRMMDKKSSAAAVNISMQIQHKKMKPYFCGDCNSWHVASNNEKDFSHEQRSKETINDSRRAKKIIKQKVIKMYREGH